LFLICSFICACIKPLDELTEMKMSSMQPELDLGYVHHRRTSSPGGQSKGGDVFIVVQPDLPASEQSIMIANGFLSRLDVTALIRPLHVTIHQLDFFARLSKTALADMIEAVSMISFAPFMVTFDQVLSFRRKSGKSPLVLCNREDIDPLFALHRQIVETLAPPGIDLGSLPAFTPHMTLFYSPKRVAPERLDTPVQWLVSRLHIVRSHVGRGEHEVLWPLPPSG
jgi:2'-5' RNA ligase